MFSSSRLGFALLYACVLAFPAIAVSDRPARGEAAGAVLEAGAPDRPLAPSQCTAQAFFYFGGLYAFVSWTDNADNEDGFLVERRGGNTTSPATVAANTPGVVMPYYPGRNHYRVRAFNAFGASKWSNTASLTR